jgi:hypothetical protein
LTGRAERARPWKGIGRKRFRWSAANTKCRSAFISESKRIKTFPPTAQFRTDGPGSRSWHCALPSPCTCRISPRPHAPPGGALTCPRPPYQAGFSRTLTRPCPGLGWKSLPSPCLCLLPWPLPPPTKHTLALTRHCHHAGFCRALARPFSRPPPRVELPRPRLAFAPLDISH